MRLDKQERKALRHSLRNVDGDIFLFGSRLHDDRKGGDIDLLVFSKGSPYRISQEIAVNFFKECEEKIDVIVMDNSRLTEQQQAFVNTLKMEPIVP
ncbi:nucleotidyltransferase domain-containing protein [bacterium]|nr:nucleotidyltransferase domain-containing protein [candidate division CSSED10-310 bacterium]